MNILIDAYNISLEYGTGVATYGRGVCDVVSGLHHSANLLYGKNGVSRRNGLLAAATFLDARATPANGVSETIKGVLSGLFGSVGYGVDLSAIFLDGLGNKIPAKCKVLNCPNVYSRARTYFQTTGRFYEVELREKIDVAHWTFPLPIKIKGAKNIYTIHDLIPLRLPYFTLDSKNYFWSLVQGIVRRSDAIVTVSEASKNDIVDLFDVDPSFVTNTYQHVSLNAESVRGFGASELKSLFGLEKGRYLIFCGAIEPKKNLSRLLESYLTSDTDLPFVVVGPDGWMSDREPIIKKYLGSGGYTEGNKRILRLGYLPRGMMLSLIQSSRAMLFPSVYEGFGLPPLEAMSLGVPVVTSDFGALKEVVQDAALTVNPFDINSIRHGIEAIAADDGLFDSFSKLGLDRAGYFSFDRHREALRGVDEKLV